MSNYFQCPYCGAPNDSTSKCTYCGEIFKKETSLLSSKTDKGQFDLAIYEFRNKNNSKAIAIFDSIIIQDSSNKVAWFYKYLLEFALGEKSKIKILPDSHDFCELLKKIKVNDIEYSTNNHFIELIFFVLENAYKEKHRVRLEHKIFFDFLINIPVAFRNKFINLFFNNFKFYTKGDENGIRYLVENIDKLTLDNDSINVIFKKLIHLDLDNFQYFKSHIEDYENLEGSLPLSNPLYTSIEILSNKYNFIGDDFLKYKTERFQIINNVTMTHENKNKNTYCFIATATMGSYDHPVVLDLREFRDEWLLKRKWGIEFTKWYYKYGKIVAVFIEKSKFLKILSFYIIVKPIHFVSSVLNKQ